jgi:hypothetical protein
MRYHPYVTKILCCSAVGMPSSMLNIRILCGFLICRPESYNSVTTDEGMHLKTVELLFLCGIVSTLNSNPDCVKPFLCFLMLKLLHKFPTSKNKENGIHVLDVVIISLTH